VLYQNKPGAEFLKQLKEKLNGKIIELPDERIQVFYDFVDERQLQDWRVFKPYKAAPEIKNSGMAFGRVEPEDTEKQWDRDIRLNLVFDPDPQSDLEIDFDVTMGTNEPWSQVAWVLGRRDGYSDTPFFFADLNDCNEEWRQANKMEKVSVMAYKDGYIRANFLKRGDPWDEKHDFGHGRWLVPPQDVPKAESYQMKVLRQNRKLIWKINGQTIGEHKLADEELCLTERLLLCNYGKGTGAIFRNLVIRSRIVDVDPSWPAADREEAQG
jgi:hypothetical protein